MAFFTVMQIVDGDTFKVSPDWRWQQETGNCIRPTGYDAPELDSLSGALVRNQLARMILGKQVELASAYRVDRGRLVCDVYFNGKKLDEYFPRY